MKYLIHSTEQAAWERAHAEGKSRNLPYHRDPKTGITRYVTSPRETSKGKWAVEVTGYNLTDAEKLKSVKTVAWRREADV